MRQVQDVARPAHPCPAAPPAPALLISAAVDDLILPGLFVGLFIVNLGTASASHAAAGALLVGGPYTFAFWGGVVAIGILVPLVLQPLELAHRIPHSVLPALLVLAGGFALRWVIVNAGQASQLVHAAGL